MNLFVPSGLTQLSRIHENEEDFIHRIVSPQQLPNMLGAVQGTDDPTSGGKTVYIQSVEQKVKYVINY